MYRIVNLEQGSAEWLEFRKNKIMASEAPIIMGVSPWSTVKKLWEEKLDLKETQASNRYMQRGNELEPVARQVYESLTNTEVSPVVVVSEKYPWMGASLDGLSACGTRVVEIKCPGKKDHDIAASGKIPEKYYPQLQHQLAVLSVDSIDYFSFNEESHYLVTVQRDDDYIKEMIKREQEFYNKMLTFESPDSVGKDKIIDNSDDWIDFSERAKTAYHMYKHYEELWNSLKDEAILKCADGSRMGNGLCVQYSETKGAVDYKSIPELQDVDLEKYRKPSYTKWSVIVEKDT